MNDAQSKHAANHIPLVYLVDDEPLLLDLAEATLASPAYKLKKFLDPERALADFMQARTKPALLITDYSMCKMNGLELVERCRALKPDLKSIMVSGSAGAEILMGSDVKVDQFVGKPYHPADLAGLVRRVLGLENAA